MSSGAGQDTLDAGSGADTLSGGEGADLFILTGAVAGAFITTTNSDRITDWEVTDRIQLRGPGADRRSCRPCAAPSRRCLAPRK